MRQARRRVIRLVGGVIFVFVIVEIAMRVLTTTNSDGQVMMGAITILPRRIPIQQLQAQIDTYEAQGSDVRFVYDEHTGWRFNPNYSSDDGLWRINSDGIRANIAYSQTPAPNVIRMAAFGDSFTAGDDVPVEASWPYLLEQNLRERGWQVEVLNFGVNGYGMDQAYLLWQQYGEDYQPDLVIFGFHAPDMLRNDNVFAWVELRENIFTKPRFVQTDANMLLINTPPLNPTEAINALAAFPDHPLAEHEPQITTTRPWWAYSRTLAIVVTIYDLYQLAYVDIMPTKDSDIYVALAKAITQQFATDVIDADSRFIVTYLPSRMETRYEQTERGIFYQPNLTDYLSSEFMFIRNNGVIQDFQGAEWTATNHYSALGNERIAANMTDYIDQCLQDGSCYPQREGTYRR